MNLGHRVADSVRNVVAMLTPVPKDSQFSTKGVLTPDEFVEAGDQLVFKFPTWEWQSSESRYQMSWLPQNKQFLLTRNIPCRSRVKELGKIIEEKEITLTGEDWIMMGEVDESAIEDIPSQEISIRPEAEDFTVTGFLNFDSSYIFDNDSYDREDINDFNASDLLQEDEYDIAAAPPPYFIRPVPDSNIIQTRTYDLSITYDKYYQTPRIWLFGYDENNLPLSPQQIFEDIIASYASRTVTVDPHPCTGIPTASIHPCRHADVMKQVVQSWRERGKELKPHLAIVILLKFISGVVPTIDYDFTMDIEMLGD